MTIDVVVPFCNYLEGDQKNTPCLPLMNYSRVHLNSETHFLSKMQSYWTFIIVSDNNKILLGYTRSNPILIIWTFTLISHINGYSLGIKSWPIFSNFLKGISKFRESFFNALSEGMLILKAYFFFKFLLLEHLIEKMICEQNKSCFKISTNLILVSLKKSKILWA